MDPLLIPAALLATCFGMTFLAIAAFALLGMVLALREAFGW